MLEHPTPDMSCSSPPHGLAFTSNYPPFGNIRPTPFMTHTSRPSIFFSSIKYPPEPPIGLYYYMQVIIMVPREPVTSSLFIDGVGSSTWVPEILVGFSSVEQDRDWTGCVQLKGWRQIEDGL